MVQANSQRRILRLLDSIERDLTDWIPIAVQDLKITVPVYALFLWYQDFESDWIPHLGVATQAILDDVTTMEFDSEEDRFDLLWCPQQWGASDEPGRLFLDECELVEGAVTECYELLAESHALDSQVDDRDGLKPEVQLPALQSFREMMHRVGCSLRKTQWNRILKPTDDFAVVVADYMGMWLDLDLPLSIDSELRQRLIARNMLPSE
jgi:hypothetical protein